MICLVSQNPSVVPQLVELLSSSLSNAEGAALILSKCCQVRLSTLIYKRKQFRTVSCITIHLKLQKDVLSNYYSL